MITQNKHIPAGSYQETSELISITIVVQCQGGSGNQSTLTYTPLQIGSMHDIANINGNLQIK